MLSFQTAWSRATQLRDPAARIAPELPEEASARIIWGRRKRRVPTAPAVPRAKIKKHTSVVTTGSPDRPSISCAMVLTAYFALFPATNSSCHRHRRILGDITSLSDAALQAYSSFGEDWSSISGPWAWTYNGKRLDDIRREIEDQSDQSSLDFPACIWWSSAHHPATRPAYMLESQWSRPGHPLCPRSHNPPDSTPTTLLGLYWAPLVEQTLLLCTAGGVCHAIGKGYRNGCFRRGGGLLDRCGELDWSCAARVLNGALIFVA